MLTWLVVAISNTFWFLMSPIVDGRGEGLSLTRFLSIFFAILAFHTAEMEHSISTNLLILMITIFAVAFGKSMFSFLLTRLSISMGSNVGTTVATNITADLTKIASILKQRDPVKGIDPSP